MSALSVLSPIAPTAPGGTASASAEAAASDGLFAGMVAAVAPSAATANSDGNAPLDLPAAESDAVEAPVLDAVIAAPAWPPIPLIAPAPPPVAPNIASEASDSGATPPPADLPNSPALDAAPVAPPTAPALAAPVDAEAAEPPLPNMPVAPAAPLDVEAAEPVRPPEKSTPTQGVKATEPSAGRALDRAATAEAVTRPTPSAPAETSEVLAAPRSTGGETAPVTPPRAASSTPPTPPAPDDGVATPPVPSLTDDSASVEKAEPRLEAAAQARPASPASPQITATTPSAPPPVGTASQISAEPLKALTETPRVAQQPDQAAPAIVAPAPRPQMPTPTQSIPTPPAEADDAPEQTPSAPSPASDAEGEAAPSKGQPAPQAAPPPTTTLPVTPARNGSARLDDRPSNAASSGSQTDARADAKGDALGGPRSPLSSAAAQATTPSAPVLSDHAAAKPVAPVDAAPLDASAAPDLAPSQQVLDAQNAAPVASRDLGLSQLSRATVETTALLAAQILKKLDGRSTRFDMALTPDDLGRVDVSMEIDSDGRLTARLAFDNPAAATELRGRADELRRQLQEAGFQLTQDSLEFSDRNPSSGFGGGAFDRAPDRRAFAGAARVAADADTVLPPPGAWTSLSQTHDRVDLKV